jgi:beta-lactamase class A
VGLVSIALILGLILWFGSSTSVAPDRPETSTKTKETPKNEEKPKPETPAVVNLQPTVTSWADGQSGNYGIVVYDPANKKIIGQHQPNHQFFTASIYKLYVAYLTLMDFQAGTVDPNEVILNGQTRKECVFKMIHSSDSPCGETVLNEIGQAELGTRLKNEFGFKATSFPGFTTSSGDVVRILARLYAKEDLNVSNTNYLLKAMRTQIYRTGLPQGMPQAKVADKVGFNSPDLWVDAGIITLPNKRDYIVCIFGNGGVGSAQIRDFAATIYTKLNK